MEEVEEEGDGEMEDEEEVEDVGVVAGGAVVEDGENSPCQCLQNLHSQFNT